MGKSRRVDVDEFVEREGRRPPVDETEDAWQWEYRGTKAERDQLAADMGFAPEPDEPPTQDESLF